MNLPPVGEPNGLKPLPKLEPRGAADPAEGENPFTLPVARNAAPPDAPPQPAPVPEKPAPAAPPPAAKEPPKGGFGARLFRSLRGETKPAEPPARRAADVPEAPEAPEQKGFSLPSARLVEADETPVEEPREQKPPVIKTPVDDVPVEEAPPRELERERPETPAKPEARFDRVQETRTPAPEPLLPTSARDVPAAPPRPEPAAPARKAAAPAPATEPPSAAASRKSLVMIAAIAGAALGTVSVLAVYLLVRPDTAPATSATMTSPFGRPGTGPAARPDFPVAPGAAAPAPAAPPPPPVPAVPLPALPAPGRPVPPLEVQRAVPAAVPKPAAPSGPIDAVPPPAVPAPAAAPAVDPSRPSATFGSTPRLVVTGGTPKPAAVPQPAASGRPAEEARPRKPKGPRWVFEGVVFDLLTTRGVFGAKLIFVNPDGDVVGETDTGPAGRYKVSLPAGAGYKLKISHGDYTERYIDEGDATTSLRDATPEERRMLTSAAARNIPWTGETGKPVHRDLALVPKTPEEP